MRVHLPFLAALFLTSLVAQASLATGPIPVGAFLVARASIIDPRFARSVVLIVESGEEGHVGLIINRPTSIRLDQVLPGKERHLANESLFYGGPVAHGTLTLLLRAEVRPGNARRVFDDVYRSSDVGLLDEQLRRPDAMSGIRVLMGQAGWGPDQLENEIARGDWLVTRAGSRDVFRKDPGVLWHDLVIRLSGIPI